MTSASLPRVLLLFGGRSSEHSVSCVTAAGVLSAIDTATYDVVAVGITKDGTWTPVAATPEQWSFESGALPEVTANGLTAHLSLDAAANERGAELTVSASTPSAERDRGGAESLGRIDVVFPLLHGPFGEDGTLQGMLELADMPYVGAGVAASAIGMDKHHMKVAFAAAGFDVGPYAVITDKQWRRDPQVALASAGHLVYPLFVKPARAGSSMGITRVDEPAGLRAAVEEARQHDPKVVIEQGIEGREIECGVLEGRGAAAPRTTLPGEIAVADGSHTFYDFEAKYVDGAAAQLSCPASLPDAELDRVRELAAAAFDAIGAEGLSRVDFFYTPDGRWVINEINTLPGFTPHSMYPQMWEKTGLSYPDLIDELIQLALERRTGLR
ncbi:D-alanine--D-alanine ligase family protein [Zhihengliuella flava]|uniref:D-alanine--D-alanine ligase n=1 Tax=Zhihengliuella flava TaxID=1285193 RepID=A0A931DA01_9MICC|nr:D-alanine--D-alanine ligase family protein [Zhihengliuella flava]MBG6083561.1 D-alanine-D-alanine ligase [Zhihengliuella flava]